MRNPSSLKTKLEQDAAKRALLEDAKPWAIEVLNVLGRLDKLKGISELGARAEDKLREIAMRAVLRAPHEHVPRQVVSFREALIAKDSAAWFLHKYLVISGREEPIAMT